ncbi:MAG TPA: MFS transporter [Actinomycetota bacterium]
MSQAPARRAAHDEDSLFVIAFRRIVRRLRHDAGTPEFGRLLLVQASGSAGDALLALALAGSLFFSVPETTARGRVGLYLALTVAPFAIVSPLLSRVLDHFRGSLRWAMLIASLGRGVLAWLLATRLDSLYLFPIAFGVLVMSRASLVVRGAALPNLVPEGRALVTANATLSKTAALAALAAGIPGIALVKWPGPGLELLVAAAVYLAGAIPALRLPSAKGRRHETERLGGRHSARSPSVRQALVAMAGLRLLVGFLVFHLAFALRREDFGSLGLGLLIGSAAMGGLVGAIVSPRLKRALREEGIVVVSLVVAGLAGLFVGRWFSLFNAGVLVFAFGAAGGSAKVAFDAIVQRETPEGARGWAFARFESFLQLAWVAGAAVPLALAIPSGPGVFAAGVAANLLGMLYVAGRRQVQRSTRPPQRDAL